jgi:hypothetical protein
MVTIRGNPASSFVRMKLAEGGGKAREVSFRLVLTEGPLHGRNMIVERVD